jgi:hypothetical protein
MDTRSAAYWRRAAALDPSLLHWETSAADLDRLELRPQRYSRSSLFRAVARQEPVVFSDYPLRSTLRKFFHDDNPSLRLKTLFGSRSKTLTKFGPSQSIKTRRVHEVVDIWQRNRAIVSANDIFYRHPKRDSAFDCEAIGDFSVLRHAPARVRDLEVATLLMGTTGCMTDSHSDDSDGCNQCIAGRKFWLVWDRLEGTEQGLQDCEYETVYEGVNCYFDIRAFSSLRSSRWFTVSKGQTLFLPGNLTHKVLTIERYIGISNFYVGLPNALTSLTRWRIHGAKMVTEDLWSDIVMLVMKRLHKTAGASHRYKHAWGFSHLGESLDHWNRSWTAEQKRQLLSDDHFKTLHDTMRSLCGAGNRRAVT